MSQAALKVAEHPALAALAALRNAPPESKPISAAEEAAVRAAMEDAARIPHAEVVDAISPG